jgi:glycosyltransferase involved in cell wall biosynthesis
MTATADLVSVVMPAFNAEVFVSEAIESILGQTYRPLEIVLVDDGSTDRTPAIAASFRVPEMRYVRQQNRGAAAATNTGISHARGPLISFLNADDVWTPERLALQVSLASKHPEVDIILGHLKRMWRRPGRLEYSFTELELALSLQSCLCRRPVFQKVGSFDEDLRYCFDWDWFFRARELGVAFFTHPELTNYYRRHDDNITLEGPAREEMLLVTRRSLERRRARSDGRAASLPGLATPLPAGTSRE